MSSIAERVAARFKAASDPRSYEPPTAFGAWKKKDNETWLAKVQYVGEKRAVEWEIQANRDHTNFWVLVYGVELGHDYKAKKEFDTLDEAQRFAKPFIDRNGIDKLRNRLDHDFKKV